MRPLDEKKLKRTVSSGGYTSVHLITTMFTYTSENADPLHNFMVSRTWKPDLVMALVKKYTLEESVLIAALACQRCQKELAYKFGLPWGKQNVENEPGGCCFCEQEETALVPTDTSSGVLL